jgi:DNA polymerase elongation subunit (family B)
MDRAERKGFHVIYCHTDGFWVPAEAEPLYADVIGNSRGEVKIERRAANGVLVRNKN